MDVLLTWKGVACAVEVDGPGHFASDGQHWLGTTRARHALLRRAEHLAVASVHVLEWERLGSALIAEHESPLGRGDSARGEEGGVVSRQQQQQGPTAAQLLYLRQLLDAAVAEHSLSQ